MPSDSECILWEGHIGKRDGYGKASGRGAHRQAWEKANGPIPKGMWVDHICRVRACVNVKHLRIVTPRQNTLENNSGVSAVNAKKTHCWRGHELIGDNVYLSKLRKGKNYYARNCITCVTFRLVNKGRKQRGETPHPESRINGVLWGMP